jgi:urease accessory protein
MVLGIITIIATMTTARTSKMIHHEDTNTRNSSASSCLCGEKLQPDAALAMPALLRLLAWLSPAFPTGAFAYSHGLEWAVEAGDVSNEISLAAWLHDIVAHGTGRADTILLRHAHRSADDLPALTEIANVACATALCRERQSESLDQGRAFMLAAMPWGVPGSPERIPYAVAVGAISGLHRIPEEATAAAYLQAIAGNLISAAVRLVPLGQTTGLRVLAALEPVILSVTAETKDATLDDLGGCVFRSDLAAMRHETQYTRLFRS